LTASNSPEAGGSSGGESSSSLTAEVSDSSISPEGESENQVGSAVSSLTSIESPQTATPASQATSTSTETPKSSLEIQNSVQRRTSKRQSSMRRLVYYTSESEDDCPLLPKKSSAVKRNLQVKKVSQYSLRNRIISPKRFIADV
jgi:hypothetical protein